MTPKNRANSKPQQRFSSLKGELHHIGARLTSFQKGPSGLSRLLLVSQEGCAQSHSIDGLRRSGYSFIIWEKNCTCVGLAARRSLASLWLFRVAAIFDWSSSRVLSL